MPKLAALTALCLSLCCTSAIQANAAPANINTNTAEAKPEAKKDNSDTKNVQKRKPEKHGALNAAAVDQQVTNYDLNHKALPMVLTTHKDKIEAGKQAETINSANPLVDQDLKSRITKHEVTDSTSQAQNSDEIKTVIVKRPTVALALGGGGARGAAHIGVLRVFEEEGIPIDYIVGNSMGSIVGGLYSAGVPIDKISNALEDGSLKKAYFPSLIPPGILIGPLSMLAHPFMRHHYAGLWSGEKFGKYLQSLMPIQNETFDQLKIPFSAVAVNLADGKAYRLSKGNVVQAIRASATITPFLRPVSIDDKIYVDGGLRANLPAFAARETGANIVIAVLVDEPLKPLPAKTFYKFRGIASRLSDVMLAVADEHQLQYADIIINPDVSGIPIFTNRWDDAKKAEAAGEVAARKAMPEIRKRLGLPEIRSASRIDPAFK